MINDDKRSRFTFRIPKDILENLKEKACSQGVSLNSLLLEILGKWIKVEK